MAELPNPQAPLDILVVDDDPRVLGAIADILRLDDHMVTTAVNGREALTLLRQRTFDLLVSDLGMPGMSGIELAQHAKQIHPGLRTIIVTGFGARITAEERRSFGIIGVIDNPFRISELLALLELQH